MTHPKGGGAVPRSELRLRDLMRRQPTATVLLTVIVPTSLWTAITKLSTRLGASKTDTVVALLNTAFDGMKGPHRRRV